MSIKKITLLLLTFVCLLGCKHTGPASQQLFAEHIMAPGMPSSDPVVETEKDESIVVYAHYDQPVNGFTVSMEIEVPLEYGLPSQFGDGEIRFIKGDTDFCVPVWDFCIPYTEEHLQDNQELVLSYSPKPAGEMFHTEEAFFFSDVDFDGSDELVVKVPFGGARGMAAYSVYELDGIEREDAPFLSIDDLTEFRPKEKAIIINRYHGVLIGGVVLKYIRQRNGRFTLTDSTHIDYGFNNKDEIVDSVRYHYHRQRNEMVFVRKEVLK